MKTTKTQYLRVMRVASCPILPVRGAGSRQNTTAGEHSIRLENVSSQATHAGLQRLGMSSTEVSRLTRKPLPGGEHRVRPSRRRGNCQGLGFGGTGFANLAASMGTFA